jgi:photosynthetic reaction center cytochrome c subunit
VYSQMIHPTGQHLLIASVFFVLGATLAAQPSAVDKQPMAEQVFTNVQVLKGIPVSEFMSTMGFFAASVGLNCVYCHVPESLQDWKKFAEDVPRKRIARNMIAMVNTINKANFGGRPVITCYSCHHGNERPKPIPSLAQQYGTPDEDPNEIEVPPQAVAGPSAEQLLDKFVTATGAARANHNSFSIRGTYEGYETYHQQVPFELWVKAPAQMTSVVHTQNGDSTIVYDGSQGWVASPNNPVMLLPMAAGAESDGARLDAQLFFPSAIRQALTQWRSGFPQTSVGDKDVQVIEGVGPGRTRVKLFFEVESGLLIRQLRYVSTIVGTNPYQVDYADYRDVGGVKLPHQWTVTWTNGQSIWRVKEIQADTAIPAGRFAKPAPAVLAPAQSGVK